MTGRRSDKRKSGTSRFISLILRHKPETIGISLGMSMDGRMSGN